MNDSLASSFPLSDQRFGKPRVAAAAEAGQARPIVAVIGLRHSGASLCAHVLSALGIDMADDVGAVQGGLQGSWERPEIVECHERILALFNRSPSGPLRDLPLPPAWWADPRVHRTKDELAGFLKKRMGEADFGFKDPRTLRLMPLWHQIFDQLQLVPKIIVCLRNPAAVARSCGARDRNDFEIAEYRWVAYMSEFFRYAAGIETCAVEYEDWFRDPLANFEKLRAFLGVQSRQSEADLRLLLSGVIDPARRNDGSDHRDTNHPAVQAVYRLASDRTGGREARSQSDIVSQFLSFQRLQQPLLRAFEEGAEAVARLPRLEQEVAELRSTAAERDRAIDAAELRAGAAESRAAEMLAEAEAARARLAEAVQERDGIGAELEETRGSLGERDAALNSALSRTEHFAAMLREAEAERTALLAQSETWQAQLAALAGERDKLDGENAKVRSEIEALHDAAAERGQAPQEQERRTSMLHSEIASLRVAFTEADRSRKQAEAATEVLRGELATLRNVHVRAEERLRETQTASTGFIRELAALKTELAAAREVGRAVIDALRWAPGRSPLEIPKPGWRTSALQRFGRRNRQPPSAPAD